MSEEGAVEAAERLTEELEVVEQVADERFTLARTRTHLALDRTLLAWIRTTLSMVSFGFGIVALFRSLRLAYPGEKTAELHLLAIGFGVSLLVLGLVAMVLAGLSHWADIARLRRGEAPALRQLWLSLAVVLFLAILGVSGLVALIIL